LLLSIDYQPGVSLTIHQKPHIELAYEKFISDKTAAARSPAVSRPAISDRENERHYSKLALAADDAERARMKGVPFLSALATIMYIAHFSNPHVSYHTSFLGQFMHDPSYAGYLAVLDLIIYLYHNRDIDVIVYYPKPSIPKQIPGNQHAAFIASHGFHAWADASWLLRSPAGYFLFMSGGPIDWASRLIRVICLSSAEAEISAGSMAGKRLVFITELLGAFGIKLIAPIILLIDNSAAGDLTKKFGVSARTAHFLRWQHYLRWLVLHQYVTVVFVGTKEQLADILTKVVDISTFLLACRTLFTRRSLIK
jgi:hypothetical protein